jgi:NAD(P)-dependent dehydrogenase (short-subunit alcohol dehydrogenase family)
MSSERPLAGRTALVTGSGRNIGRAIALAFGQQGANVVVNGHRDREALERVVEELRAVGAEGRVALADVGDPASVQAMVDDAAQAFGGVDILVSNASVRLHQPFLEITPEDWQRIINTNLSASFYLARACLPGMAARGWGRVIHISGRDGFTAQPNRAHNIACKAGVVALAKAIAVEFGPFGVTANAIGPGVIDTVRDAAHYPGYVESFEARRQAIPVRRLGRVEDIAGACLYLCGEDGGFVSGQSLHLNGGEFMF